ncbi:TSC22 domain family protein 1 isoform 2 [Silurus asotus]|uniref:TSC22 domain family protein 1 isoform 2 n=1 Tax=Silurus asotus TaxID=30991 RepID=A0AAD5FBT4_SILAS|nr:TSC22 domain family protein 1 isoform 2 [Silurus asotus]
MGVEFGFYKPSQAQVPLNTSLSYTEHNQGVNMCLRMNSCPAYSPTESGSEQIYKRSRSCSSSIDIDSRIARAMDLVKTHMLSAVREEVESLKETIKNLTERNLKLERDNYLLKSLFKYQTALALGQIINHQTVLTSGQICGQFTNHQPSLGSGQFTNHQPALGSGQIPSHQPTLGSGQIPNNQPALGSGQIPNHQPALGHISNHDPALTSGQMDKHYLPLTSVQTPSNQTALRSNPQRSENVICKSLDYQNNGCFSVNTQLYLNATYKKDVRCV